MEVSAESKLWRDKLASLVDATETADSVAVSPELFSGNPPPPEPETLKDQIRFFAEAWGELLLEFGRGCRDVAQQTILTDDSYIVRKTKAPLAEVSGKLRFLNHLLPEDRDPVHAWPVILLSVFLALSVLNVNSTHKTAISPAKEVVLHPPNATRLLLPDGRYISYLETGVSSDEARVSIISPHSFLSSRLSGTLQIKESLLKEFSIRLITFDLPGFGESDPHPDRNLTSSAMDLSHISDSLGIHGKFWVLGYSSGSLHTWAALNYIPNKVAGAIVFAPFVNPYDSSMTKEEMFKAWETLTRRKKLLFFLARRFPAFLPYFYRRTFLSGKHGCIEKWLSSSLGKKDKDLVSTRAFRETWERDVEESVRQNSPKPFVEEAVIQVSDWGFSLEDLQAKKKCTRKGIIPWLEFMYGGPECELTGYLGPIHIWQGMNDTVVPSSMTDYVARVLPSAVVHRLSEEGHFSYFSHCNECHRVIFSTVFGSPKGPIHTAGNSSSSPNMTV